MLAARKRIALGALYVILTLVILDGALWLFHGRVKLHLDEELGRRLTAIATTVSLSIDTGTVKRARAGAADESELESLREYLERVSRESGLDGLYLLDLQERDLLWSGAAGERPPVINLDPVAVAMAEAGLPAFSETYSLEDLYFKSGYAPVLDGEDVIAIVAAEADAGYFKIVRLIKRSLFVVSLIGLAGAAVLAVVLIGLARSISRAEEAVGRANLLATLGHMAAAVAHDIRNPLSIIGGAAQRLKSIKAGEGGADDGVGAGGPGTLGAVAGGRQNRSWGSDVSGAAGRPTSGRGAEEDELLDFITEEVDRLEAIVKSYLEMARPTGGVSRCEVLPLLNRAADMCGSQFSKAGIELSIKARSDPADLVVRANSAQIQQAFMNILTNAGEAMPSGGKIEVELYTRAGELVVEFRDSGGGIPKKEIRRVTEPFYSSKQSGSGLGLSIVDKIAREAGGRIDIESQVGVGTTVTITVPLDKG